MTPLKITQEKLMILYANWQVRYEVAEEEIIQLRAKVTELEEKLKNFTSAGAGARGPDRKYPMEDCQ